MVWDMPMCGHLNGDYFHMAAYQHTWEYWRKEQGWMPFIGYQSLCVPLGGVLLIRRGRIQACRRFEEILGLVAAHLHPPEVTWAVPRLTIARDGVHKNRWGDLW